MGFVIWLWVSPKHRTELWAFMNDYTLYRTVVLKILAKKHWTKRKPLLLFRLFGLLLLRLETSLLLLLLFQEPPRKMVRFKQVQPFFLSEIIEYFLSKAKSIRLLGMSQPAV